MPYFYDPNNNINVLFIHIPKTGGSSIEDYLYKKYNIERDIKSLFSHSKELLKIDDFKCGPMQHRTYDSIMKYEKLLNINKNNLKVFAVVRNPYYRAISDLFYLKLIEHNFKPSKVYNAFKIFINGNIKKHGNHSFPQYLFVCDKNGNLHKNIHIMKTETLNDDMKKYGYEDFNIISNTNIQTNKINNDSLYEKYLNSDIIKEINKIYSKDFILFNYPKKNPEKYILQKKV